MTARTHARLLLGSILLAFGALDACTDDGRVLGDAPGQVGGRSNPGASGGSSTGGVSGTTGGTPGTAAAAGFAGSGASGGSGAAAAASSGGIAGSDPGSGGGTRGGTAGSGGAPGGTGGGSGAVTGGNAGTAGATVGGTGGTTAGVGGADGGTGAGITGGAAGSIGGTGGETTGGAGGGITGPCDIYAADDTPCVAAYSMVRVLSSTYSGPLYQVRTESSDRNTGSGGTTYDIGMTTDGFADKAAQDAACVGTTCTVSLLYDQSGHGNDLPVAKRGIPGAGEWADTDDFESMADAGALRVGGHDVYSLYMEARHGYRSPVGVVGNAMPLDEEPQGIYMLADGTHYGPLCCWEFGNVPPDPTAYANPNALFFGDSSWTGGGDGDGPWFAADLAGGLWSGGWNPAYPDCPPFCEPNPGNPSLPVPFAFGILKTNGSMFSLRMADVQRASDPTVAYEGDLPMWTTTYSEGGIVLGVGADNANDSWGTFYEGAIVAGWPSEDADLAVMQNIQSVGYGQ